MRAGDASLVAGCLRPPAGASPEDGTGRLLAACSSMVLERCLHTSIPPNRHNHAHFDALCRLRPISAVVAMPMMFKAAEFGSVLILLHATVCAIQRKLHFMSQPHSSLFHSGVDSVAWVPDFLTHTICFDFAL